MRLLVALHDDKLEQLFLRPDALAATHLNPLIRACAARKTEARPCMDVVHQQLMAVQHKVLDESPPSALEEVVLYEMHSSSRASHAATWSHDGSSVSGTLVNGASNGASDHTNYHHNTCNHWRWEEDKRPPEIC